MKREDINEQSIVERFITNIINQTEAISRGNARDGNKFAKRYIAAFEELRKMGDVGRAALVPLLQHPRGDVRTLTACYLLRYQTEEALSVLQQEAAGPPGLISFEASEALQRWKEGSWNIDPQY